MNHVGRKGALDAYQQVSVHGGVLDASPHQLILMLFEGALSRIQAAKGYMTNGDVGEKCTQIAKAIAIVDGLRAHLDMDAGGEIAANLDRLYEYIGRRLVEANRSNNPGILTEAASLITEIKRGWEGIADVAHGVTGEAEDAHS